MTPTFSLLVLRAQNPETTRDFYSALGLNFEQEQHGVGPIHYAAQLGDVVLEIYPLTSTQTEVSDSVMLGFQVVALQETLKILGSEADIKSSDWGCFCIIQNPDGRKVRLTEATLKD